MVEARATVTRKKGISRIWIVPIVAVLLGAWMVYYTWSSQGPSIDIVFTTASGIEAGKTKIKALSVQVGVVESVTFAEDFESVVVTAKIDLSAKPLLREDTQFWVVQARIGAGGVSGLGTILSGGYIELSPGSGAKGQREFEGLDVPPVTPAGTPGLELILVSEHSASVSTGNPILYKDFTVGRVESADFDVETEQMQYRAFIKAPYDDLVSSSTRFWNMSGISFSATTEGIELQTGSLESLLIGGVAFGLPPDVERGNPVDDGAVFQLFPDHKSSQEHPYRHYVEYVVQFASSVRGLQTGAPVEYRGVPAGVVERLMIAELAAEAEGEGSLIPVLIRLEPGRLKMGDSAEGAARLERIIERGVANGMRASLSTGSLLTGSLYVSLDRRAQEPAELGRFAGYPTIPTVASGLEGLEQRVATLLDKLNALPLEEVTRSAEGTLQAAGKTLEQLERSLQELNVLLASEEIQALPRDIQASLVELDRTLKSVGGLAAALEQQPNSLIFDRRHESDPEPPAGSRSP